MLDENFGDRGNKRVMNIVPITLAAVVPSLVFYITAYIMTSPWQYTHPKHCISLVVIIFLFISLLGLFTRDATHKRRTGAGKRDPTWMIFIFLTCVLQWVAATATGFVLYTSYMQPYYDFISFSTYLDVDPSVKRGTQLMDSGRVIFSSSSYVDRSRAMGFKTIDTFCVAPITSMPPGNATKMETYDFWAVGKNCCLGSDTAVAGGTSDYKCDDYNNPRAHGGLRLMADTDRPFYRLAVQQAEAAYGIKADHPLFYTWTSDPIAELDELLFRGDRRFIFSACAAVIVQLFLVATTAIAFSKVMH